MKKSALGLLLILTACGEYGTTGSSSGGGNFQQRSMELSTVSGELSNAVIAVCNALAQKAAILPTAVGSSHTFSASQTDCDGNLLASASNITTIQGNATSGFFFRKSDGLEFLFPDVETQTAGQFVDLCRSVSSLQNPIIGTSEVTFFQLSNNCPQASGEVCLELTKAFVQGNVAVPHTITTIRVRTTTSQGKVGFWTYQQKVTKSFCADGKTLTLSATLK